MFGFGKHSRSIIGLDVGARRIKAVQLDLAGGALCAAVIIPRTEALLVPSAEEVSRLSATLYRAGFVGNRIALAMPSEKLITQVMEFPRSAGSFEQLARMELARSHRCAPDALELGAWELPGSSRAGKSTQVMVIAGKHEDSTPLLDAFENKGLDVLSLQPRACALARATAQITSAEKSMSAILDFGWNAATLVLVHQGIVFYERKITEGGLCRLHRELCQRLNIDSTVADYVLEDVGLEQSADQTAPPEARDLLLGHLETLIAELLASFEYCSHQFGDAAPSQLLVIGGGAAVPGFVDLLAIQSGIPSKAIAPPDLLQCPQLRTAAFSSPLLLPALGLAMAQAPAGVKSEAFAA
jgi:Tfp pilus assembly PilM family ATPase